MVDDSRRTSRVFLANAIKGLASIYSSSLEALAQPVENEADAGATKIWVVLEGDKIVVVGNGRGMIPYMLDDDRRRMNDFFEAVERGEAVDSDLERIVPMGSPSRSSLQWMMECIALSAKKPGEKGIRGMRGIGSVAYLQYADQAQVTTQPDPEMAMKFWGDEVNSAYVLEAFSRERLNQNDATYKIDISTQRVTDPWGRVLQQGTRVEITGIRAGEEEVTRPNLVSSYLRNRFGDDIRQGRYQLTIVDRVSDEAKRQGRERLIEINPPQYKGIPLVDEVADVHGSQFRVEIWYDQNGRDRKIRVAHKGSEKFDLSQLDFFKDDPWNSGKLWGTVEFPTYPNEDELWDTSKTRLLPSVQLRQWEKAVKRYTDRIEERLAQIREKQKEQHLQQIGTDLAAATSQAMERVEAFSGSKLPGLGRKKPTKETTPRKEPEIVTASVFNQHNRQVPGVVIELLRNGKLVAKRETLYSGISFGRLESGKYVIRAVPQQGVVLLEPRQNSFELGEFRRGYRAVFRIVDPEAQKSPEPRTINKLTMEFAPLDDPGIPYEQWLHLGIIRYNSVHPELMEAFDSEDEERISALLAQYTAAAVTEFTIGEGDIKYVLLQQTLLFIEIHKHYRVLSVERKRKAVQAMRKRR